MIVFFIFLIGLIISLISTIYVHSSYWEEIKCETCTAEEIDNAQRNAFGIFFAFFWHLVS